MIILARHEFYLTILERDPPYIGVKILSQLRDNYFMHFVQAGISFSLSLKFFLVIEIVVAILRSRRSAVSGK